MAPAGIQMNGDGLEFLFLMVVGLAVLILLTSRGGRSRRSKFRKTDSRPNLVAKPSNNWGMADPQNQITAIAKVDFERTRLLNASEYRVLRALEGIVETVGEGHRVMAQTSLGELIKPKDSSGDWKDRKDAYASINSKRLDFAIIDKHGLQVAAVEYQGKGHHQGSSAFMRDAVKREALRRADVPFLEVKPGTTPSELRDMVIKVIAPMPIAPPKLPEV